MRNKIVIAGGGHAGVEAALAIAQLNCKAIIITMDKTAIANIEKEKIPLQIELLKAQVGMTRSNLSESIKE